MKKSLLCSLVLATAACSPTPDASPDKTVGQVELAITGGSNTPDATTYPWMVVMLDVGEPTDIANTCGGTLIAPQWVLTADHCFNDRDGEPFEIGLGMRAVARAEHGDYAFDTECAAVSRPLNVSGPAS